MTKNNPEKKVNTENLKWYEKASGKQFTEPENKHSENGKKSEAGETNSKKHHAAPEKTVKGNSNRLLAAKTISRTNTSDSKNNFPDSKTSRFSKNSNNKSHSNRRNSLENKLPAEKLKADSSLFSTESIPEDAVKILNSFNKIVADTKHLTSRQISLLPQQIRQLSHELTDERSERHLRYMNQTTTVSAYIYYFSWWNLVRLTRLFANLKSENLKLEDDDVCIDIGSGPLTLPIALLLARPELRTKKITWYCLDLSSTALSEGEEIFLSICAKLKCEPWKIIRVKGEPGTPIKQKAKLITAGNVFNELADDSSMPPEFYAKKYCDILLSYLQKEGSKVLVIEPGVPKAARFISLLRNALIRKEYSAVSPCTHCEACPMDGKRFGKWCNFSFSTEEAPVSLKKLSEAAGIPKERAVLSFIFAQKVKNDSEIPGNNDNQTDSLNKSNQKDEKTVSFRITSDLIKLPFTSESGKPYTKAGYYACSEKGLLLVLSDVPLKSGECFTVPYSRITSRTDKKTGAIIVNAQCQCTM